MDRPYTVLHLEQGSSEWLDMRRSKVGASDAPAIMGVGYCTQYTLWQRKLGVIPDILPSKAMERGTRLEPEARNSFIDLCGYVEPIVLQSRKYDWMVASLDGMSPCGTFAVEIKCPGEKDHSTAVAGIVPEKYYPQLQHQLYVSGLDMIYYYSYDGQDGVLLEVERDEAYIESLLGSEAFFYDCLASFSPPPLCEKDYEAQNSSDWMKAVLEYRTGKDLEDAGKAKKDSAKARMLELCKGRNAHGAGLKLTAYQKKGRVNYGAIPELQGVDLETYRGEPTQEYRITLM